MKHCNEKPASLGLFKPKEAAQINKKHIMPMKINCIFAIINFRIHDKPHN